MKEYCLLSSCRRTYLCEHFGDQNVHHRHDNCCDNCNKSEEKECAPKDSVLQSDVCIPDTCLCAMANYCRQVNNEYAFVNKCTKADLFTGLNETLISDIALTVKSDEDIDMLSLKFPYVLKLYIDDIKCLIRDTWLTVPTKQ